MGYFKGEVIDIPENLALELSEMGMVELVKVEQPKPDLPADFPARDHLLNAGVVTVGDVKALLDQGTLTDIKGIGKGLAAQIEKHIK